jgi:hypothetical protein
VCVHKHCAGGCGCGLVVSALVQGILCRWDTLTPALWVCLCICLWWFVLTYNTLALQHSLGFSCACLVVNNHSNTSYSLRHSMLVDIVVIIIYY